MLYVRMFFTMLVGLYTSRIVLKVLGVEDFGVYNVVGGVVGMLGFLNSTMSGATSRFLTYELGRGDAVKLSQTFNSALIVHIGIAVTVFLIAETLGLWFVYNKIVIPEGRETAAMWVYQFSVLSAMIGITQVPYNASIIAHERLDVYAYVEIFHTLTKLLIVYLLLIIESDKLIVYGILIFLSYAIVAVFYRLYGIRHFQECRFQLKVSKQIIKSILSFSGYNLFAHFGSIFYRQGTTIIINNFFGVVFNASYGIATTVANMITSFSNNVITAFRPPITKSYAVGHSDEVKKLTLLALDIAVFLMLLIAVPAMIEMDTLYRLWLIEVPEGVVLFTKLIIVSILFEAVRHIMTIGIHATGKVRYVSMANGLLMTLTPIVIFYAFLLYRNVYLAFVCEIITQMALCLIVIFLAKRYIPYLPVSKILFSLGSFCVVAIFSYYLVFQLSQLFDSGIVRILLTVMESSLLLSLMTFFIVLNASQRKQALLFIRNKWLNRIK